MLKVASEIVRQQAAFFDHGVRGLKPLSLRDIADQIAMHESTVSRVTSNKYMQTPRGTFELKYFFTSAINSATAGESHSSEAVKHRIKQLIDAESPRRVLSDDKIVDVLRDEGIEIARRTVAKYREMMRIQSSVHRRRKKSNQPVAPARWQREMSAE
jgi:RNA polymerase sigma-54 factor